MIRRVLFTAALVVITAGAHAEEGNQFLPIRSVSPGAAVQIDRAAVCDAAKATKQSRGWVLTASAQSELFSAYGIAAEQRDLYLIEMIVPAGLGGQVVPANLWPHLMFGPWNAGDKVRLEKKLERLVCAGKLDLEMAQQALTHDWTAAYESYVGHYPPKPKQSEADQVTLSHAL